MQEYSLAVDSDSNEAGVFLVYAGVFPWATCGTSSFKSCPRANGGIPAGDHYLDQIERRPEIEPQQLHPSGLSGIFGEERGN